MRFAIGSCVCLLLLAGCGSNNHLALQEKIDKEKVYCKNLQKSEKVQFYDDNVSKALFTATYLFRQTGDSDDGRDEQFVIGMFTDEEDVQGFGEEYSVSLEGTAPKSIAVLDEKSEYLKEIPVATEWSMYYLVTFPHISKKSFTLTFSSKQYGQQKMHFAKVAKYVISKKVF